MGQIHAQTHTAGRGGCAPADDDFASAGALREQDDRRTGAAAICARVQLFLSNSAPNDISRPRRKP
jgi:hypothetical protein